MRVYLDICAIQRPLDDQTQLRVRAEAEAVLGLLALCEAGTLVLVASGVHTVENERSPHPDRRAHADDVLALARSYVPASVAVLRRAEPYAALGIKRLDALHLASAVEARANYFCTPDDGLLRRGRGADTGGTVVVSPLDLVVVLSQPPAP